MKEMRRKAQEMKRDEIIHILNKNTSGILSVFTEEGYPYGVPLSYVYISNKIIFHCANVGYKIDAIKKHNKVSFTIIDQDIVVAEENSTLYKSVIVFGKIEIVEDVEEKREYLRELTYKYSPQYKEKNEKEITMELPHVCVLALNIEYMSGKQAKGLL